MRFSLTSILTLAAATFTLAAPAAEPAASNATSLVGTQKILSTFAGTNAYWLPFLTSDTDVDTAFKAIKAAGLKVVRTWGFHDSTSCSGVHFQCWSSNSPSINYGSNGFGRMDVVVNTAAKYGIKLIIPFVNNWGDYGGMDVYVSKLGGSGHSSFYTSSTIQNAYKNYVKAFVNRYKSSSAIYAWELANEPRCNGCATSIITNWASTMSAHIKSLDSSHYVALGDEGFMTGGSAYPYQGGEGVDFVQNLKISTLDFGTLHLYTTGWGQSYEWGNQWIKDHQTACAAAGKSCVIEEYGVPEDGGTRDTWIKSWHNTIKSSGMAGDLFWQYGINLSGGKTHDDTYTIFTDEYNYQALVVDWAKSR